MGFDGLQLGLGLGLNDQSEDYCIKIDDQRQRESQKKKMENQSKCHNKAYPSLTLGPPQEEEVNDQTLLASKTESYEYFRPQQVFSPSAESSFSNSSSIKRERDQVLGGEEFEVEVEKVPIREGGGDVDEDGNPRKKLRLTKEQSAVLEENFREHSTLNPVP
ncbi:putative homeobox-leucine zipper protein HAT9-like [Sesbania bispinosa]|nr:putative homeobox-leucine zipper protein HAT9-like [Sesbania bispinosa]